MNHPIDVLLKKQNKSDNELALLWCITALSVKEGFSHLTKEEIYDAALIGGKVLYANT